jgi:hypothetical protein
LIPLKKPKAASHCRQKTKDSGTKSRAPGSQQGIPAQAIRNHGRLKNLRLTSQSKSLESQRAQRKSAKFAKKIKIKRQFFCGLSGFSLRPLR